MTYRFEVQYWSYEQALELPFGLGCCSANGVLAEVELVPDDDAIDGWAVGNGAGTMPANITASSLEVGNVVVESRAGRKVVLDVERVSHDRFTHYLLSDGSERVLSPYVEVEVLTNAFYWTRQAPRS